VSYALRRDVRYRRLFDEAVVIRQEESEVLGLNLVGTRVLELVEQGRSVAEMLDVLRGEFEVAPATLAADVAEFLRELVAAGVIAPLDGAEATP